MQSLEGVSFSDAIIILLSTLLPFLFAKVFFSQGLFKDYELRLRHVQVRRIEKRHLSEKAGCGSVVCGVSGYQLRHSKC